MLALVLYLYFLQIFFCFLLLAHKYLENTYDACKRLPLIIEVLEAVARRRPDRRLRWTLIGDGDSTRDRAELLARSVAVKVRNLEVSFAGLKTNDAIQRGFHDNPPQWHMLMSSTEGIPVSMGEAMSYGIPCVTTDVGQTTELADHENSIIFPVDVDVEKCADTLAWRLFDTELQERDRKSTRLNSSHLA